MIGRLLTGLALWLPLSGFALEPPGSPLKYFRSDGGVAQEAGALPGDLDAAGALMWRVELDAGHSTPILSQGKLLLTTYRQATRELATVALDPGSGRLHWRRPVATERIEATHAIGSPATATVACDGHRVFAFFGSHGLLCYDLEGNLLWDHPLGPFRDEYGAGSSPILIGGRVVVNQDHDLDSFLIAFDTNTGKVLWKTPRPDAVRSYATPAVWPHNGRPELLVAGALELAGYDPTQGRKLWSIHGLARIVIPTPVSEGDTIFMASWAPGGDVGRRLELPPWSVAQAKWDKNHDGKLARSAIDDPEVLDRFFRMDLNQDGALDQQEWERHAAVFRSAQNGILAVKPSGVGELQPGDILWKYQRGAPYVTSPLLDHGRLWLVKEGGIVTVLEAASGRRLCEERLPGIGNYFASPVTGDGKVYFASEPGVVTVVANQAEWRVLSSRDFREKIYASPTLERDRLYLRTSQALYCFHAEK